MALKAVALDHTDATTVKIARSNASEAYDLLLSDIETGGLPPGTRLREIELAKRFSISRTPIREALKRLEHQGLVAHEPHFGATVASLEYSQVAELYHLREVLEGTAARLAAQYATPIEVGVLQRMVDRDRGLLGKAQQLAITNRQFHQQIRDAARNRFVAKALEDLRLSLALLSGTTLATAGRPESSIEEHAAIVAKIAERDCDGAELTMRSHIRNSFSLRILLISDQTLTSSDRNVLGMQRDTKTRTRRGT